MRVNEQHIDGKPHEERDYRIARANDEARAFRQSAASQQPEAATDHVHRGPALGGNISASSHVGHAIRASSRQVGRYRFTREDCLWAACAAWC